MEVAVLDSEITLADGRVLAFTELGATQGPVVVHCHGAPSS